MVLKGKWNPKKFWEEKEWTKWSNKKKTKESWNPKISLS